MQALIYIILYMLIYQIFLINLPLEKFILKGLTVYFRNNLLFYSQWHKSTYFSTYLVLDWSSFCLRKRNRRSSRVCFATSSSPVCTVSLPEKSRAFSREIVSSEMLSFWWESRGRTCINRTHILLLEQNVCTHLKMLDIHTIMSYPLSSIVESLYCNLNRIYKVAAQTAYWQIILEQEYLCSAWLYDIPSVVSSIPVFLLWVNHLDLVVYECSEHLQTPDVQQVLFLLLCLI